jgi:hypothetical protein
MCNPVPVTAGRARRRGRRAGRARSRPGDEQRRDKGDGDAAAPLEPKRSVTVGANDGGGVERREAGEHARGEIEDDRVEVTADGDRRQRLGAGQRGHHHRVRDAHPMLTRQMNMIGAARRRSHRPSSSSGRAALAPLDRSEKTGAGDGHGGLRDGRLRGRRRNGEARTPAGVRAWVQSRNIEAERSATARSSMTIASSPSRINVSLPTCRASARSAAKSLAS